MQTKRPCLVVFIVLALIGSACAPLLTPPPSPTPASTATPGLTDPAMIVLAFWEAVNNQDLDAAMSLVAEDIKVTGSDMNFTGRDTFRVTLKSRMAGIRYMVSDLIVTGNTVTYSWQYFKNDVLMGGGTDESMVVADGKIVQFNAE
jgi:predicted ester cyclase